MKRILYLLVIVAMTALFLTLDRHNETCFSRIEAGYRDSTAVNLDASLAPEALQRLLFTHGYVQNSEDARFVADFLVSRFRADTLPESIQSLVNTSFRLPASLIEQCGTETYRRLLDEDYINSGWDSQAEQVAMETSLASVVTLHDSLPGSISVQVQHRVEHGQLPVWKAFFGLNRTPAEGILVRLDRHELGADRTPHVRTLAYALSDNRGQVCFTGLDPKGSYSVLPVHRHWVFGPSKGTTEGSLELQDEEAQLHFSFVASPRSVRAFTADVLQRMRQDGTMTVRTPQMYRHAFRTSVSLFLCVWVVIFLIGNTGRRHMDNVLAVLLMGISFTGIMLQYAINDALTARLQGVQMAQGAILGGMSVIAMLCISWARFFRGGYMVKFNFLLSFLLFPFRLLGKLGFGRLFRFIFRPFMKRQADGSLACPHWMDQLGKSLADLPGSGYLWVAILLTAALFVFGQSIGGMKVNLVLGGVPVQPSEIVKFLLVIFMAVFFFQRGDRLTGYSTAPIWCHGQVSAGTLMLRKIKVMTGILIAFAVLMSMYFALGDLGPALVLALSFIIIYSLMKSRIEMGEWMNGLDEIKRCDLTRLLVGVATFIACLMVGRILDGTDIPKLQLGMDIEYRAVMTMVWFIGWFGYGWRKKNVEESPIMFNLIIVAFIYGSSLLNAMDMDDAAERLQSRTDICMNTFGELGEDDENRPTVNAQTAIGFWALADGGLVGNSFGCSPNHIPAYHTDFILQSIGLMGGWMALVMVFMVYALMGWRGLLAGYRSKNSFLLFLCAGIVIVTAVQTLVVAAGSLGLIPMSGLVVPWLSYGRVSLFFHLLAWGSILSVSAHDSGLKANPNRPFGHTLALLSLVYAFFMAIIVGTLYWYMVLDRDHTLNRPLYVTNAQGLNIIQPNPFIESVVRSLKGGDIYDRNGVLVATSSPGRLKDKSQADAYAKAGLNGVDSLSRLVQKRYYPFGNHLTFMVGDANTGLYFNSVDAWDHGYLAESRHQSEIRGFDNVLKDKQGRPLKVDLHSPQYKPGRYLPPCDTVIRGVQLRDYSAILPMVKAGRFDGDETCVSPRDVQLTVDAVLQTRLQQQMAEWKYRLQENRYATIERRSVVIMDATHGDLIASAVWPLPQMDRIGADDGVYRDSGRPEEWTSFTDMDLGLLYGTAPGSTAKLMSALAAVDYANQSRQSMNGRRFVYPVHADEQIHASLRTLGRVNFHDAIVYSSNCYFINQVNDLDLYGRLARIYGEAGMDVGHGSTYRLLYRSPGKEWLERIKAKSDGAVRRYRDYLDKRSQGMYRKLNDWHISHPAWQWSWGQAMTATPVAVARVAAATVNGQMPVTRFRMDVRPQRIPLVADGNNLACLRQAMRDEALKLGSTRTHMAREGVYGKSGTAEREYQGPLFKDGAVTGKINDAWYTCIIPGCNVTRMVNGKQVVTKTPVAIAVRVERTSTMSSCAKLLTEEVVLPVLAELGYTPD